MTYIVKRKFRGALGDDVDNAEMASLLQHIQSSTAGYILNQDSLTLNNLVVRKTNKIPYGTDKYPKELSRMASLRSTTKDAHVFKGDSTSYTTTHDVDRGESAPSGAVLTVGQQFPIATDKYAIWRTVVYLDLSGYGASITVSAATLTITCGTDFSTTDFTIRMVDGSDAENTLSVFDYGDLRDSTTAIASTITTNTWTGTKTFTFNAAGLALLSGSTTNRKKLCLRSEEDINSSAPTGLENVGFASADDPLVSTPLLSITYTVNPTSYIWNEGSNFRSFDENSIERKYIHTDDVDNTPVDDATTDPISSNWAYDNALLINNNTIIAYLGL